MLFSDRPRTRYEHPPVHEVICQLRFPAILSISETPPAKFQEAVRDQLPRYAQGQDTVPPQISGQGEGLQVQQRPPVVNYRFLSEDGAWKLNLTQEFIALSTLRYAGWEDFARRLDRPLAALIQLYRPAFFQRVGLRYVNLFSRKALGLEGTPWAELFPPAYAGPLGEEDVEEERVAACGVDLLIRLDSSCAAKIHAGPGLIRPQRPQAQQDQEVKFILDMDLSMGGSVSPSLAAGALETLHGHAGRVFEGALTDDLRQAMGPVDG